MPNNQYLKSAGKVELPKSLTDAKRISGWPLWKFALDKELGSFVALEVHSKPMTMATVRKAEYKLRAVRSHIILTCKADIVTGAFLMP